MANGKVGAPKGNRNAAKGKLFSFRLMSRIEERAKMNDLVDAIIDKALEGDIAALREVADRIEGKVAQRVENTGPEGGPLRQITRVIIDKE